MTQDVQPLTWQKRTNIEEHMQFFSKINEIIDNITALQNVQGDYVKKAGAAQTVTSQIMVPTTATGVRDTQIANGTRIQNDLDAYAPMIRTTGNQDKAGNLSMLSRTDYPNRDLNIFSPPTYLPRGITQVMVGPNDDNIAMREEFTFATPGNTLAFTVHCGDEDGVTDHTATLMLTVFRDGKARLQLVRESGTVQIVPQG